MNSTNDAQEVFKRKAELARLDWLPLPNLVEPIESGNEEIQLEFYQLLSDKPDKDKENIAPNVWHNYKSSKSKSVLTYVAFDSNINAYDWFALSGSMYYLLLHLTQTILPSSSPLSVQQSKRAIGATSEYAILSSTPTVVWPDTSTFSLSAMRIEDFLHWIAEQRKSSGFSEFLLQLEKSDFAIREYLEKLQQAKVGDVVLERRNLPADKKSVENFVRQQTERNSASKDAKDSQTDLFFEAFILNAPDNDEARATQWIKALSATADWSPTMSLIYHGAQECHHRRPQLFEDNPDFFRVPSLSFAFVFHYYSDCRVVSSSSRIFQYPLGIRFDFLTSGVFDARFLQRWIPLSDRRYVMSFEGAISQNRVGRIDMARNADSLCASEGWKCKIGMAVEFLAAELFQSLGWSSTSKAFRLRSYEQYANVLSESIFSLCPSGHDPETFRIYESLLFGAIPIIHDDCHSYYETKHLFICSCYQPYLFLKQLGMPEELFVKDWNVQTLKALIEPLIKDPNRLANLYQRLQIFQLRMWQQYPKLMEMNIKLTAQKRSPQRH